MMLPIKLIPLSTWSVSWKGPGARIGYRYRSEKAPYMGWKHYTDPIQEKEGDPLEIITHRLGSNTVLQPWPKVG